MSKKDKWYGCFILMLLFVLSYAAIQVFVPIFTSKNNTPINSKADSNEEIQYEISEQPKNSEAFSNVDTVQPIVELEKATSSAMDELCEKLRASNYNSPITLSDDEMTVLRTFLKQELPERADDWWSLYPIQGKLLSTNGYCKYNNCMFFICSNRRVLFLDMSTDNTVGINNHLDYPMQYKESPYEYCQGTPYGLYYSSNSSYILIKKQQGLEVKLWEFGDDTYTWQGKELNSSSTADQPPTVVVWDEDYHFFIVDGNLFCIQEGKNDIKLLSTDVSPDNVATVRWSQNTLYYSCSSELHMLNMTTLEDVKLAEDVSSGPSEITRSDASYNNSDICYHACAMYNNTSGDDCLVSGYFDENNQAVVSESKVEAKIKEYRDYVEDYIKELSETVW